VTLLAVAVNLNLLAHAVARATVKAEAGPIVRQAGVLVVDDAALLHGFRDVAPAVVGFVLGDNAPL